MVVLAPGVDPVGLLATVGVFVSKGTPVDLPAPGVIPVGLLAPEVVAGVIASDSGPVRVLDLEGGPV